MSKVGNLALIGQRSDVPASEMAECDAICGRVRCDIRGRVRCDMRPSAMIDAAECDAIYAAECDAIYAAECDEIYAAACDNQDILHNAQDICHKLRIFVGAFQIFY